MPSFLTLVSISRDLMSTLSGDKQMYIFSFPKAEHLSTYESTNRHTHLALMATSPPPRPATQSTLLSFQGPPALSLTWSLAQGAHSVSNTTGMHGHAEDLVL